MPRVDERCVLACSVHALAHMTGIPTGGGSESGVSRADARRVAVVRALERLERGERDALDGLEESVGSWVVALREGGASAEAAATMVAELVGTPVTTEGRIAMTATVRAALVDLAVNWSAAAYGQGAPPADAMSAPLEPPASGPVPDPPQITS